jgi:molybdenum cofactor biosynthesis enzyme MoaA
MRCVMPHVNLEIRSDGTFGPCCLNYHVYKDSQGEAFNMATHSITEVWQSQDRRDYATRLDQAALHDCDQCWNIEDSGGRSKRQTENLLRRVGIAEHPTGLDIKFSNVCNLKCVICGPYNSTQWYSDWKQLKGREFDNSRYKWINTHDVLDKLRDYVTHCDVLEFFGGEPLLIKQHLDILHHCVSQGSAPSQEIRMNTNGTIRLTDQHLAIYAQFAKVGISWSIDSVIASEFEYQRYPAKFQEVLDNFQHCYQNQSSNMWQNMTYTINAMNLLSLPELLDFVRKYPKISLHLNILTDPKMLGFNRLPKAAIIDALRRCDAQGIRFNGPNIEDLLNMDPGHMPADDLIHYLDKLDALRSTNWRQSLPRLSDVL